MEKKTTHKNKDGVSEPKIRYETTLPVSKDKIYSHEDVFGNLKKKLKAYYNER